MSDQDFTTWILPSKPEPGDPQERVGDSDFPPDYFQVEPRPPAQPDQPAQKESPASTSQLRASLVANLASLLSTRLKHMAGRHNQKRHGWRYGKGPGRGGLSGRDLSRALGLTAGPTDRSISEAKRIVAASTSMHRTPEAPEREEYRKRAGLITPIPKISKKPEVAAAPKPPKPPRTPKPKPAAPPAPAVDIPYRPSKDLQKQIYTKHDEWLVEHGIKREDLPRVRAKLEAELQKICDDAPLVIRAPAEGAIGIISSGRFKSQFETGTTSGSFTPTGRTRAENKGLGVPTTIPNKERPIYGYLKGATIDDGADGYGEVMFYMKPAVRNRTTVTVGDSLGIMYSGEAIGTPLVKTNLGSAGSSGSSFHMEGGKPHINRTASYFEAQIHKGVKITDVANVHFSRECFTSSGYGASTRYTLKSTYKSIESSLKKLGIEVIYDTSAR